MAILNLKKGKSVADFPVNVGESWGNIISDLISLKRNLNDLGSLYPQTKSKTNSNSRFYWMEGDYSVAIALNHAYSILKKKEILLELQTIAKYHVENFDSIIRNSKVLGSPNSDISLTSGSSGLYYVCNKIYKDAIRDYKRFWILLWPGRYRNCIPLIARFKYQY